MDRGRKAGANAEEGRFTDKKISLRKGDLPPLQQGLSAVQCGFARHTSPLKATINHYSVDAVWTLSVLTPPRNGFSVIASCKYSGAKCA